MLEAETASISDEQRRFYWEHRQEWFILLRERRRSRNKKIEIVIFGLRLEI
jgi:hypothetical protein